MSVEVREKRLLRDWRRLLLLALRNDMHVLALATLELFACVAGEGGCVVEGEESCLASGDQGNDVGNDDGNDVMTTMNNPMTSTMNSTMKNTITNPMKNTMKNTITNPMKNTITTTTTTHDWLPLSLTLLPALSPPQTLRALHALLSLLIPASPAVPSPLPPSLAPSLLDAALFLPPAAAATLSLLTLSLPRCNAPHPLTPRGSRRSTSPPPSSLPRSHRIPRGNTSLSPH